MREPSKIALIGGGKGTVNMIKAMKHMIWNDHPIWDLLRVIVNVSDDGGSTGRIAQDQDVSPSGDIRRVLAALAPDGLKMAELVEYRFKENQSQIIDRLLGYDRKLRLSGEAVGSIILAAFEQKEGSFERAIQDMSQVLQIRGSVYPCCLERLNLVARLEDGQQIFGQTKISHDTTHKSRIREVRVECHGDTESSGIPVANPVAVNAINNARIIMIGPGALHASILAAIVVPDIAKALVQSPAYKVFMMNTAIRWKETHGFGPEDHVQAILDHIHGLRLDLVVLNSKQVAVPGGEEGVELLTWDEPLICNDIPVLHADLIDESDIAAGSFYLHDSGKIRAILPEILKGAER